MMALFGFSVMCGSLADQKTVDPSLRLSCNALSLSQDGRQQLLPVLSWGMSLGLKIETPVGWKPVWCEEDKVRVTMEDSTGNKTTGVECGYSGGRDDDPGSVWVFHRSWNPAAGSQWVRVKGDVPFIVSGQDSFSEPVTVKLVKGVSMPVVLKDALLGRDDGKPVDVKATLKVKDYVDAEEKGKKRVEFELSANRELGFRALELQTTNGKPVIAEGWGGGNSVNGDSCGWNETWQMDDVPEGEVRVMVRYAGELRRVMAKVDSRAALSGFGGGEGNDAAGKATPGANRKAADGGVGETSSAAQPGSGKVPVIKAALDGFDISGDTMWVNNGRQELPPQLVFRVRLEAKGEVGLDGHAIPGEQGLEVTDSTGRVLKPAVFDRNNTSQMKGDHVAYLIMEGKGPELATPAAEWVRVKGTLRVPMANLKKSPAYELPLVKGAERHVPVPGMEETGGDADDVARAGDAPVCKLWLEDVTRTENGDVQVEVSLEVEGVRFDFDGFELVDDKGKSLNADSMGSSDSSGGSREKWGRYFFVRKAAEMKQLRVKLKYKVETEIVPVPVDIKVGLVGPLT